MSQRIIGFDEHFRPVAEEAGRHEDMEVEKGFPYTLVTQSKGSRFTFSTSYLEDKIDEMWLKLSDDVEVSYSLMMNKVMPDMPNILQGQSESYKIQQITFAQTGKLQLGISEDDEWPLKWFLEVDMLKQRSDFMLLFREVLPDCAPPCKGFCKMKVAERELIIGDWARSRDNRIVCAKCGTSCIEMADLRVYPAMIDVVIDFL